MSQVPSVFTLPGIDEIGAGLATNETNRLQADTTNKRNIAEQARQFNISHRDSIQQQIIEARLTQQRYGLQARLADAHARAASSWSMADQQATEEADNESSLLTTQVDSLDHQLSKLAAVKSYLDDGLKDHYGMWDTAKDFETFRAQHAHSMVVGLGQAIESFLYQKPPPSEPPGPASPSEYATSPSEYAKGPNEIAGDSAAQPLGPKSNPPTQPTAPYKGSYLKDGFTNTPTNPDIVPPTSAPAADVNTLAYRLADEASKWMKPKDGDETSVKDQLNQMLSALSDIASGKDVKGSARNQANKNLGELLRMGVSDYDLSLLAAVMDKAPTYASRSVAARKAEVTLQQAQAGGAVVTPDDSALQAQLRNVGGMARYLRTLEADQEDGTKRRVSGRILYTEDANGTPSIQSPQGSRLTDILTSAYQAIRENPDIKDADFDKLVKNLPADLVQGLHTRLHEFQSGLSDKETSMGLTHTPGTNYTALAEDLANRRSDLFQQKSLVAPRIQAKFRGKKAGIQSDYLKTQTSAFDELARELGTSIEDLGRLL